jgi:Spy/CpxP family protein refolding chaperone
MATTSRSPFNASRLFGGAVLVAVLGSVALSAWAQPGPGGHRGGHDGGPGMMAMPMQGRMIERMLDSVNATAEQRAQIKQITDRAAADRKAQFESHHALREQGMKLFSQPVVDANAAEALRKQMLQQHDEASKRMMQTMLEVSRVLTPEQRKQLADRMAQRGEMMRRHMQERQSIEGAPAKK